MGLAGQFVQERVSLGTMKMRTFENQLVALPRTVNARAERVEPFAGPLAILVDGLSASATELFAGGMQSIGRARIFGETSSGMVLGAVTDRLPNGDVLYHTIADFVNARGERMEGKGVIPDTRVPLTREHVLSGKDPALEAAVQWIAAQAPAEAARP
jgi:carboxyl-terminal processing protease